MTQVKISTGYLESLLGLGPLQARIVDATFKDDAIHLTIESYIGETLPEGLMLIQKTQSINTKLVPA